MKRVMLFFFLALLLLAACAPALPQEGETISWERAVDLLNSGQVTMVVQAHSLEVTLTLKSGVTVKTIEPTIDAIFAEIQKCGETCSGVVQATE